MGKHFIKNMTTNKQQFIHFLKQNNVYEQFLTNFDKRESFRNFIYPKSKYLSEVEPLDFLNRAFTWCYTKEGHDFWYYLSIEWKDFYSKIK